MVVLRNHLPQIFENDDLQESFFKFKEADCVLYSQEGTKFKIHKEILSQTRFMQNILFSSTNVRYEDLEIFCPCSIDDLEHMVKFLYSGKISNEENVDKDKILDNLKNIFGYSLLLNEENELVSNKVEPNSFK